MNDQQTAESTSFDQGSAQDTEEFQTQSRSIKKDKDPEDYTQIEKLFSAMKDNEASDLHLKPGQPPLFRISTKLREVNENELNPSQCKKLVFEIMNESQKEVFLQEGDLDFSYGLEGIGRFRINVFRDRGAVATAVRRVDDYIPDFEELHLPKTMEKIARMKQGLVIFAGPTGQGKSTSIASILQRINETRREHIITIEDPIEYLLEDKKSVINQREIGIDVKDFETALKYVVRQDPDIILLGELRDEESFDAGLMAAETGHLVFGTVHASSAPGTLGRILDLFPPERESQIRQLLRFNLKAVVSQKLMPSCADGVDLVPAVEIMYVNPMVQKLIKNEEHKKIHSVMKGGKFEDMQDFNQSLMDLLDRELINKKTALEFSPNPEQLKMNMQGIDLGEEESILG